MHPTTANITILDPWDPATVRTIASTVTTGAWSARRIEPDASDDDGTGGVREPRPTRPVAPSGAATLRVPVDHG